MTYIKHISIVVWSLLCFLAIGEDAYSMLDCEETNVMNKERKSIRKGFMPKSKQNLVPINDDNANSFKELKLDVERKMHYYGSNLSEISSNKKINTPIMENDHKVVYYLNLENN